MYLLKTTTAFKKDLKRIKTTASNFTAATKILKILQHNGVKGVPPSMKPHKLKGKYIDNWECHIKRDLLIIWIQIESPNIIKLVRLGSHSELFK